MKRRTKYRINLTTAEQTELERLIRQQTAPQHLVKRAKIILMANVEGGESGLWRHPHGSGLQSIYRATD